MHDLVSATDSPPPRARHAGVRAGIATALLVGWYMTTMHEPSSTGSWEHHPFAGAFILLKESRTAGDFALSLGLWAGLLATTGRWVTSGRPRAAVTALAISCISIGLSLLAAASACC